MKAKELAPIAKRINTTIDRADYDAINVIVDEHYKRPTNGGDRAAITWTCYLAFLYGVARGKRLKSVSK